MASKATAAAHAGVHVDPSFLTTFQDLSAVIALPGLSDPTRKAEQLFIFALQHLYSEPSTKHSYELAGAASSALKAQKMDIANLLSQIRTQNEAIRTRDARILQLEHELHTRPRIVCPLPQRIELVPFINTPETPDGNSTNGSATTPASHATEP